MLETGEVLWLILAALGLGVTLPVMLQLFLTIREVRKTVARMSGQIEPSLALLHEFAQRQRNPQTGPGPQVAAIVAAVIPAVVAAYRSFRDHQAAESAASDSTAIEPNRPAKVEMSEKQQ
ncbi:hypothetical protein ACNOYE_17700 [Nannocystaceae bacterium ST9]